MFYYRNLYSYVYTSNRRAGLVGKQDALHVGGQRLGKLPPAHVGDARQGEPLRVRGCRRVRGPHIRVRRGPYSNSRPARVGDARQGEPPRVTAEATPASGSVCQQSARPRWRCTPGRARQGPCISSRPAGIGDARQGEPPRVRRRRRARVSAHVRVRLRGHKPVRTSFVYAQRVAALTYISSRRPSGTSQLYCVHI